MCRGTQFEGHAANGRAGYKIDGGASGSPSLLVRRTLNHLPTQALAAVTFDQMHVSLYGQEGSVFLRGL